MRPSNWRAATAACAILMLVGLTPAGHAAPTYTYTPIDPSRMVAVATDSIETTGEGANGALELVLDGNTDTYWHTKWQGGSDPLPHWFVIDLGQKEEALGRVTLTPRQSSNGSGRVGEYAVEVSTDPNCQVAENAAAAQFTQVASGSVPAAPENGKLAPVVIDFDEPAPAQCVRVTYKSSWGGNDAPEQVATLAEFGASSASEAEDPGADPSNPDDPNTGDPGEGPSIVVPEGAVEITDGELTVRTHPGFPQIVDYRYDGKQLAGQFGDPLSEITISDRSYTVTVGEPAVSADRSSVTYPMTVPGLEGVTLNAILSVKDGALTYELADITDPEAQVGTIGIPGLSLVSVVGTDPAAQILGAEISVNRAVSGDRLVNVANSVLRPSRAYAVTASNSELAAGFETNAIGTDGTALAATNSRFIYASSKVRGVNVGTVSPGTWVHRAEEVASYDTGSGIGVDPNPMVKVKVVADANGDAKVDWQDGATAAREILSVANGREDVKNYVIMRIPFNIVSQATHPFLRTLDDTKRISLATDNLGQEVLLKGYQAEGHDSAQGDYGGNYNERAGGLEDMKTLVSEGGKWNATFGIHVNATESYSEANCFADAENMDVNGVAAPCEVDLPPGKAWGWMNQAYYMNERKDLASGNVLKRLDQLRADFPADSNMNWLYWDVYYKHGWQAQRFGQEMRDRGWRLGSEWAYSMPQFSSWSHWANDEAYGGTNMKGINSQLIRYIENSYRDTFNPDPMLGNTNVIEFEGWTGHTDYNAFITNVWQRNLPAKFLQQSDIRTWEKGRITFKNGTEVVSAQSSISGAEVPVQRTITYDGSTVFKPGGSYLLPWKDGGSDRLYYWNPTNAPQSWELTDSFKGQASLTLFKLTDTGREKVADLGVSGGSVNIPATEANTAYVLYPTSAVPAPKTPNWGQGSGIEDPGFFSETLDAYTTSGAVTIEQSKVNNSFAQLGAGESSLAQTITVEPGTYSAWAWVEIEPGKTRTVKVSVSGEGVSAPPAQKGGNGEAVTTIHSSSALNATASDEKLGTYFQRVPVHFTTTGTSVTLKVAADEGDARVGIDDLRIVDRPTPEKEGTVGGTVVFEDFENVDTGYYPFVTGKANAGGDARTQLAKLHAPFSQSGWYGIVNDSRQGLKGQKYLDNVLDGQWSLLAHQENGGRILRTTEATLPLEYGHSYAISFDYQAGFDGSYKLELGHDAASGAGWEEAVDQTWDVPKARGTGWSDGVETGEGTATFVKNFAVMTSAPAFIGVRMTASHSQDDLVIDNFRVVDLGIRPVVSISGTALPVGDSDTAAMDVTTTVRLAEGVVTGVKHSLQVPEGWAAELVTAPGDRVSGSEEGSLDSVATWRLTMPAGADPADVVFTASWTDAEGKAAEDSDTLRVAPSAFPKRELFTGHDELEVVGVSSEQTSLEPAPSGFADAAIDDDPSTYWHSKWSDGEDPYPHEIVIKVIPCAQNGCTINGLEFTQRQNADNGRVGGYEIFVSEDGKTWGDSVASGEFIGDLAPQFVAFKAVEGKYVRLVETSPLLAGKNFGGAAEIRISGKTLASAEPVRVDEVVAPKATDPATCTVKPFVTIPATEGVIYRINGKAVSTGGFTYEYGGTVTVTAEAAEGFAIADGLEVEWTFSAPKPEDCASPGGDAPGGGDEPGPGDQAGGSAQPPLTPPKTAPGGRDSDLARTGAAASAIILSAAALAGAGGVLAVRRRKAVRR